MAKIQEISDKAAVGLSLLCVIHCLFFPILLILMPPLSGLFAINDALFHRWLLFAVVPISVIALIMGYFHHRSGRVFLIASFGLTLLILTALIGHDLLGNYGEVAMTVFGSCIIAFAHIRNYQLQRKNKLPTPHTSE
ncbi:MerC domain-containing protein [Aliiglaciecola sp. 3_MG-2023]|uniref:MerC domain-containing protein n=1 Tax=Aliiglaciecola sp. 3_MG-2023 TaxID=3062644 RepID=UPI0026E1FC9A|nr:MerC domain-containing protein [Aliiglaciecola sp. 3_MG-2023]MDO6694620.1 MerC domain-containing protein [Aliiglaciecola sp. 3_MG-2023]